MLEPHSKLHKWEPQIMKLLQFQKLVTWVLETDQVYSSNSFLQFSTRLPLETTSFPGPILTEQYPSKKKSQSSISVIPNSQIAKGKKKILLQPNCHQSANTSLIHLLFEITIPIALCSRLISKSVAWSKLSYACIVYPSV